MVRSLRSTRTDAEEVVDLTGRTPQWPLEAVALFADRAHTAARTTGPWTAWDASVGDERLRAALGAQLDCDPASLVIASGVRDIALALASLGRTVALERPTYGDVAARFAHAPGRVLVPWDELAEPLWAPPSLLWLTSPYRNPDGATASPELLSALERLAERHVVVQNEAYRWYAPAASRYIAGALRVGSLHKIAGPGSWIGWITGRDVSALLSTKTLPKPPLPWQRAWALFLEANGLDLLRPLLTAAVAAREAFERRLGIPTSDSGPFRLLATVVDETEAVSRLGERGVMVSAGSPFHAEQPACRLCFTAVDVARAERAADVVLEALERGILRPLEGLGHAAEAGGAPA